MFQDEIAIRGLDQFYGKKQVLRGIDLTITKGMFGLLGRKGAGKTTLLRTLAGALPLRWGGVRICGVSVEEKREIRRLVGYVPEKLFLYPSMTAQRALDYQGALSGLPRRLRKARVSRLLKEVGLEEQRYEKVRALSPEMRRRMGIARALFHNPKVVMVDEPAAGLTSEERVRIQSLLSRVAKERIVILSAENAEDIGKDCGHVAVLDGGRLVYDGVVGPLLEKVRGKTFSCLIPGRELPLFAEYFVVTEIRARGEEYELRFLADCCPPPKGAVLCEPGLREAHMMCLLQSGVDRREMEISVPAHLG